MMKLIPLFFLFVVGTTQAQDTEDMLIGKTSASAFQKAPYSEWFVKGYDTYTIEDSIKDDLKPLLDGVYVKIFMGTWCSDSQREVPHFYKILDQLDFPSENSTLIAMDRSKKTPANLEEGLHIERVPTIIFYKNNVELGRIVEYPIVSLEKDMLKILSGDGYKHAYDQ
ncbi:MAG TPA: thioredoxin family protein [Pricia antarctica]|uniref:Thioredoxin family protein n=1 Tax=Pricia antarctica TaxID=641691 RepID=A0A831QPS2_9FLAO|nr:thioredoxin family protein [Pricia antarctica]